MVSRVEIENPEWEALISEGMEAREKRDDSQWTLGDLALQVEKSYGKDAIGKFSYAISIEKKTLMNYRTVAKKFNPETRTRYKKLSFSHFATVASLEKPEAWLEKADTEEMSVEALRKKVREEYPSVGVPRLDDNPPEVYRCPECGLWRLKDTSSFEICRGHYVIENGSLVYK